MRRQFLILIALFTFAAAASAKDIYLSIGGTVSNFHTDARIFNPSTTKDIQVQASFLPVGACANSVCTGDNSSPQTVTVTVPKRQMVVLDDVVSSLFHSSLLGGVRLSSSDDFVATQRIYALVAAGTLGQFVPGLDSTNAMKNGVLIQLKSSASFRTNIGVVNPNSSAAHVKFYLYDKNNTLVATGNSLTIPPFGVIGPTNITAGLYFNAGTADISDAWVAYQSDQPLFVYGSVVDNGTTDPTFIPASLDSGAQTSNNNPTGNDYNVVEVDGSITITPDPNGIQQGDTVTFHVVNNTPASHHGFTLVGPTGNVIIPAQIIPNNAAPVNFTWTANATGTYTYTCTNTSCSAYHTTMNGNFSVGNPSDPYNPKY
jgi:plastocyanin